MFKYDHDTGQIYDPEDDETIGYLDAQPKSRGLRMAAADSLLDALELAYGSMCDAYNDFHNNPKGKLIKEAINKARGES